jgi:hypothetical protein
MEQSNRTMERRHVRAFGVMQEPVFTRRGKTVWFDLICGPNRRIPCRAAREMIEGISDEIAAELRKRRALFYGVGPVDEDGRVHSILLVESICIPSTDISTDMAE